MIIPDLNLLIYASDLGSTFHHSSKQWWGQLLVGNERVGMPWAVTTGFLRIMTNRRIFAAPMSVAEAIRTIAEWYERPQITPVVPGSAHLSILSRILDESGTSGDLVPDAHIAALAIEFGAEVHTADRDFTRFPGVQWHNPLLQD